jgi:Glycosyl hydrolases family 18
VSDTGAARGEHLQTAEYLDAVPLSPQGRERLDRLIALGESRRSPFDGRPSKLTEAFRFDSKPRSFALPVQRSHGRLVAMLAVFLIVVASVAVFAQRGSPQAAQANLVSAILPVSDDLPIATGAGGTGSISNALNSGGPSGLTPAAPGTFATPAPAAVANQPALTPHEVFGFAPYWALPDSSQFDLSGLTTVDYFSIGINPDGSLDNSGPGWDGYQSQNFIDLIDRAHAAGDRVVITVNDFSQASLDQLATSTTAPQTLAKSLLILVKAKDLDGVNLDLEGSGSGDQVGITNIVQVASQTLKAANPHYQVTMDTYASSAADTNGFYDIPALSSYVDAFFVMAYQLNLRSSPNSESNLTSSMFSNQTAVNQYLNAVPASKVILGLPFFGYDWPTTNGTLSAQPAGGPTIITYAQEADSGHPMYWDAVTDTAWTSYQVGSQWHEAFFENPDSLYLAAQMAQENGIAGVGVWALGMDGSNDQAMVSALDGNAPAKKDVLAGPSSTSTSPNPVELAPLKATSPPADAVGQQPTTTTSTTAPVVAALPASYTYAGNWLGTKTRVLPSAVPSGRRISEGSMIDFTTADPNLSCLDNEAELDVYFFDSDPTHDYVIARKSSGDCANAGFVFVPPTPAVPAGATTTTTTTAPPTAPATPTMYTYAGSWQGAQTRVLPSADPGTQGTPIGTITGFTTPDPVLSCLDNEPSLQVYHYADNPADDYVVARTSSGDCANAAFIFVPAAG